jgi:hypothetical protein
VEIVVGTKAEAVAKDKIVTAVANFIVIILDTCRHEIKKAHEEYSVETDPCDRPTNNTAIEPTRTRLVGW